MLRTNIRKSKHMLPLRQQLSKILRLYNNGLGMGANQIAEQFLTRTDSIRRLLIEQNVYVGKAKRRFITNQKYQLNEHFFDVIDTQEKAYWLGFLFADGYNTEAYRITINLAQIDREHLEKFKCAIGSTHPIRDFSVTIKRVNPCVRLDLNSHALCEALAKQGVVKAKSLILQWPHTIPDMLMRHFIRGYFDGDGWWSCSHTYGPRMSFGFHGAFTFIPQLKNYLKSKLDLGNPTVKACAITGRSCGVRWAGKPNRKFYDFIYKHATVWLSRKRTKIDAFLQSISA